MESVLLQRAMVASDAIETSQGRILPKFYVEKVWDQRMSSVLEHKKIKYSRQENISHQNQSRSNKTPLDQ